MESINVFRRSKVHALNTLFIGVVMAFGTITLNGDPLDIATVGIVPSSQTVAAGEIFTVNVSCVPGQPIKAFELQLSFDASLLQVNSVSEGDIFDGYTTIFNPGIINNTSGIIVDIYGLILGSGNVSDPGTFVTISFTAKDASGISSLDIDDVGVTDETGYISVVISDGSITVQGTQDVSPPGDDGGSPGGGGYIPPSGGGNEEDNDGNNAPETPMTPSGSMFVEMGVEYLYTIATVDPDGDDIRYRFDWDDENVSDWSDFAPSNTSVSMFHYWTSISTYEVRVIAQDENELNSSWSPPLNVTVSQSDFKEEPPVADFAVLSNASANQAIVFDASWSFDVDGVIVSYFWDFGDGKTGNNVTPSHVYENPGEYHVTLIVTDNSGNTCNKTMLVNVASDVVGVASEDKQDILPFHFSLVFIGVTGLILVCLFIFFRDNIKVFLISHNGHLVSRLTTAGTRKKIKKIDAEIEKLRKKMGES